MVLAYRICESRRETLLRQHDAHFICIETVTVIFSVGYGGGVGILPSFPTDCFDVKATASILGLILVFAATGAALGPFAWGLIYDIAGFDDYIVLMCIITAVNTIVLGLLLKALSK